MAYVITDECVSCGSCAAECPSEAISEGADHFEIDADACVDCGTSNGLHTEKEELQQSCGSFSFLYILMYFQDSS